MRVAELTDWRVLDAALFVVWIVIWTRVSQRMPLWLVCAVAWIVAAGELRETNSFVPLAAAGSGAAIMLYRVSSNRRDVGGQWATVVAVVSAAHLGLRGSLGFAGPWYFAPILGFIALVVSSWTIPSLRRRAIVGFGTAASLVLLACAAATWSGSRSLLALRSARTTVERAQQSFETGALGEAGRALTEAEAHLDGARSSLNGPSTVPIRLVPWLGHFVGSTQNVFNRMTEMVERANDLLSELEDSSSGSIRDLQAVDFGSIATLADSMAGDVAGFRRDLDELGDHWLTSSIRDRLESAAVDLARASEFIEDAADLAQITPGLLGAEGERRYFIGFVTPAEARPGMGFLGNYAEIVVREGELSLAEFGRTSDLAAQNADPTSRVLNGLDEYATRYAPFGSGGGTAPAHSQWWSVCTLSPDMPSVAQAIATLYEQAGHQRLDGVTFVDPVGLAGMMQVTGPITVGSTGRQFDSTNVVDFLVRGQYVAFDGAQEARVDLLEELSFEMLEALLAAPGIDGAELAQSLWRAAREGHGAVWSRHPVEQSVFDRLGFSGGFRRAGNGDGLAVTHLNSAANKLDAFLRRDVTYTATVNSQTGELRATATVVLFNDVVVADLPEYIVGNARGDAPGTNRGFVTLYSPHELIGFSVDGVAVEVTTGSELGWRYVEREVAVPAGGRVVLTYELAGTVSLDYSLMMVNKSLVVPDNFDISVANSDGTSLVDFGGVLTANRTRLPKLEGP